MNLPPTMTARTLPALYLVTLTRIARGVSIEAAAVVRAYGMANAHRKAARMGLSPISPTVRRDCVKVTGHASGPFLFSSPLSSLSATAAALGCAVAE